MRGDRLRSNGFFSTTALDRQRFAAQLLRSIDTALIKAPHRSSSSEYDSVLVDLVRPSAPTVVLSPIAVVPCADPSRDPRQVVGAHQLIPLAAARHSPISRQKRNPNLRTFPNNILRSEPAASHNPRLRSSETKRLDR